MNPYSIATLYVSILFLAIAIYSYFAKSESFKTFSLLCLLSFIWQGSWTLLFNVNNQENGLYISRFGHVFIIFLPLVVSYFYHSYLVGKDKPKLWIIVGTVAFSILNLTTDFIVSGVNKFSFGFYPKAGVLHPLFVLFITAVIIDILITHFRNLKHKSIGKSAKTLLVLGVSFYSMAGVDFITNYGFEIYPFGFVFISFFLIFFLAALHSEINRKLLNINDELNVRVDDALEVIKAQQGELIQKEKLSSLGKMAAGLAHEINNPLNFLKPTIRKILKVNDGLVEIMALYEEGGDQKEIQRIQEDVKLQKFIKDKSYLNEKTISLIKKISDIIEQFTFYSSNSQMGSKQEYKVSDLINQCIRDFDPEMLRKINLVTEISEDLIMSCNSTQIQQVITNCIINSVQAMDGKGHLKIKASKTSENIVIEIIDSGEGLAAETLNKVFDPFFTTKQVGQGTGLGMSISREIILSHNGTIDIKNNDSVGATVTLRFY